MHLLSFLLHNLFFLFSLTNIRTHRSINLLGVVYTQCVYSVGLIFVSARTNKRHHHISPLCIHYTSSITYKEYECIDSRMYKLIIYQNPVFLCAATLTGVRLAFITLFPCGMVYFFFLPHYSVVCTLH